MRANPVTPDAFDLRRFVDAQRSAYPQALSELRAGHKRSHWMWFVFPQLSGLGHSAMAMRYAIASLDEARAYLAHALLGARLRECITALLALPGTDAVAVLGPVDALKLRSCLTLFAAADPTEPLMAQALGKFFAGVPDPATLARLAQAGSMRDT